MNLFKKKIMVVTHDGDFHADDVFACATLSLWAEKSGNKLKIVRSRDEEIIKKADMAVDVGGIFDSGKNRFDHHQKGGAGVRDNNIPYASFGLVWKKYGVDICSDQEIADRIEKTLVMPVDARDNGVNISITNELGINEYHITNTICNFASTWQEDKELLFEQFEKALYFAKEILIREMAWSEALIEGEKETIRAIKEQNEPKILILDKEIEWHEAVSKNKNIKFVVYSRKEEQEWRTQTAKDNLEDYNSDRIKFPKDWRGLKDEDLIRISEVKDAMFCADGGWIAVAKTKEGAIEMAQKALQNPGN